jgi:hypothetical protein
MTEHSTSSSSADNVDVNTLYREILEIHRRIALVLEQNNAILSFLFAQQRQQQRNDASAEETSDIYFSDFLSS